MVIGTGKRLFGQDTIPGSFRLVDTQLASTGAVLHVYERSGGLRYGEIEVGQEPVIRASRISADFSWLITPGAQRSYSTVNQWTTQSIRL